jgi:hypothetical protein
MKIERSLLQSWLNELPAATRNRFEEAVARIVAAKQRSGKVVVITGSGPNIHEGVTTLIAELMRAGLVDGVTTSSAVVSHEMGGTLDLVKRCPGESLGLPTAILPHGAEFELTLMEDDAIRAIARHLPVDWALIEKLKASPGKTIIKAAGNLGYPMGLWLEHFAQEILTLAREAGRSFEEVAGLGADERTMLGIGARRGLPVLVTIPQLIGGGAVGLCIGDSLTLTERASRLAHLLATADVIIESGVALTQEIHDGPFETYTGHGLWSAWQGHYSYSLAGKTLIRIDLDPALQQVWEIERGGGAVTQAIADGLPKTKMFKVPFRMEMSGFARHEGSLPLIGDLGCIWPLLAWKCSEALGVELQFLSYPQQSERGKAMRDEIVREVKPLNRERMRQALRTAK